MSKQDSVKQDRILQAIKDLNWDIGDPWVYNDNCKDYTHIFLWEDGKYCLGCAYDKVYFPDEYICTVEEFYNYGGVVNEEVITTNPTIC